MTWRCVQHLLMFGLKPPMLGDQRPQRIILVDDGSMDNTAAIGAWLEAMDPPSHPRQSREAVGAHRYVRHDKNRGCHAAWNTGWRSGRGNYVAFINNDICVMPHCLERMLFVLESGRPYVSSTHVGGAWDPGDVLEIAQEAQHYGNRFEEGPDDFFGACFAVRRDVLEALNGFDEQFYLTYGDTDFMERMRDAGHKTCTVTAAVAYHGGSVTRRREFGRDRDVDFDLADRERFEKKWAGRLDVLGRHPRLDKSIMESARDTYWSQSEKV